MSEQATIKLAPEFLGDEKEIRRKIARKLRIPPGAIGGHRLLKRSIDARGRRPEFVLRYEVWRRNENPETEEIWDFPLQQVADAEPVLIVGFGPAGMFTALRLIELGFKPIVLERGKDVRGRRRDLAALNKEGIVNPESNYCFGEGGAGTFSDGKLYTRSTKRGDVRRVLEILTQHGASRDILIDAHPHIGTNKLPKIIASIRETILAHGGEVHFEAKVTEILSKNGKISGVRLAGGETIEGKSLVLATGHSARDIFSLLRKSSIEVEAKPFALGVRIEHPQALIDQMRWHCSPRPENLPAASYSLVTQAQGRGVYSFCMCPGGIICPAATAEQEVVVNGWSPSKRNSPFANSGMVVEISAEDLKAYEEEGAFAGIHFQAEVEKRAWEAGGGSQVAPAQRLADFVEGKSSSQLPDCSYLPGLNSVNMAEVLPPRILERLQEGFKDFERKLRGFVSNEALVLAVESRTSSPVRIPRDKESLMHPQVEGFFPCGEGAGYAGGIMSAAIDGERCAEAAVRFLQQKS